MAWRIKVDRCIGVTADLVRKHAQHDAAASA
jgi:hypothetical protein